MTPEHEIGDPEWQWRVVETAMFAHATRAECQGWTIGGHSSICKAWCGNCRWEIAARVDGSRGAATFAMIALAMIGATFALVHAEEERRRSHARTAAQVERHAALRPLRRVAHRQR